jgi:hypothetical protein
MTLSEVEQEIGMPPGWYCSFPEMPPSISPLGKSVRNSWAPKPSSGYAGPLTENRWIWDDYWIFVDFDKNGRAVGLDLLEDEGGARWAAPTLLDRVRKWLGL